MKISLEPGTALCLNICRLVGSWPIAPPWNEDWELVSCGRFWCRSAKMIDEDGKQKIEQSEVAPNFYTPANTYWWTLLAWTMLWRYMKYRTMSNQSSNVESSIAENNWSRALMMSQKEMNTSKSCGKWTTPERVEILRKWKLKVLWTMWDKSIQYIERASHLRAYNHYRATTQQTRPYQEKIEAITYRI